MKEKNIIFRIDEELDKQFREKILQTSIDMSTLIRSWIEAWIKENLLILPKPPDGEEISFETLEEFKKAIEFQTADPKANEKLKKMLMKEDDCFGKDYNEYSLECRECLALVKVQNIISTLNSFCKNASSKK